MSINAIISHIEPLDDDGHVRLFLEPYQGEGPGQATMVVTNPPAKHFDAVIGTHIWGDSEWIHVGETKWAKRIGHTRMELVLKDTEPMFVCFAAEVVVGELRDECGGES